MVTTTIIKKGYRQTEIGIIPEDWDLVELQKAINNTQLGGNYPNTEIESDFPLIKMGNIGRGNIDLSKIEYVSVKDIPKGKDLLHYGDILFNTRNTLDLVGKVAIWRNELSRAYYNSNLMRMKFKNDFVSSNFYINYLFNSSQSLSQLKGFATGTTSVAAIYTRDLLKYKLVLPKLSEQTAIANVLSDTDALIEKLEKLIAKKKAIKQGAMQQLLTGKKRLPGFNGEWEVKKLGKIGETYGGLSGKTKNDFDGGKYPYIPFMNIMSNPIIDLQYFDYVNIRGDEKQNKAIKGDLFFNGSSETPDEVGMCSVLQSDIPNLYLNSFCFGFRLNKDLKTDGLYLSYFFRSLIGRQLIFSLAQGATRYNLSKINFMKLEISYPDPAEQTAIATILSDMDSEIEKLEQKRDKYIMLKQGMMQQLLTGRIRIYANN
ncbi:MAG: restriction endonuclease subunit S [Candidatus Celaenobacter polaris]|nr:restriction endonuclease subunit S [Candidatus Celaenobacter polaris]